MPKRLTPEAIAKAINFPVAKWPGRCYGVARACLEAKLVKGRLSYGQFIGKIATTGTFAGRAISHHAWVELPDGRVWDPTRWVFEDVAPYLFIGAADDYDFGSNRINTIIQGAMCPEPSSPDRFMLTLPAETRRTLAVTIGLPKTWDGALAPNQLHWLANLDIARMTVGDARRLFRAILKIGWSAHIPLDNRQRVLGGK